ncbi:MAG: putative peptide maturation dehydrogenase [Dokdonella sp.]
MRVRRCATVMLEPRERVEFDLALLIAGEDGLRHVVEWIAFAPHVDGEIVLTSNEVAALGSVSPSRWIDPAELTATFPPQVFDALLEKHLLVGEADESSRRDQVLRDTHWRAMSAAMHYASRWRAVDTEEIDRQFAEQVDESLLDRLGAAPPPTIEYAAAALRRPLPRPRTTVLDDLLDRRVTCRNYDDSRKLTMAEFSSVLYRTFGARAVNDYAPGVQLLKKGVPSAGGLHPTEAYLLVQHVDGVESGLYHYHPIDHALEPIKALSREEATNLAKRFVAAQAYFIDAHVLVIPTSRFVRNFWKYRNHAKAYRALILDVGHLSQTLYLAATELGLAAFITAAINEVDIEEAFGLDPLEEGPLAVCGFGIRAPERTEVEFDPLSVVWPTV